MISESPQLSVIIVNYNGRRFLDDCFESLERHLADVDFEIVVIDNASSDDSCDYIRQHFPYVKLEASRHNHGFGKGNNEAVKRAKGEYLLLINNDTIVLDDLKPVLDELKSDPAIGAIGINMLDGNRDYLPTCGNFPNLSNMFRLKKLYATSGEFKTGSFQKPRYEVDWLGGSLLFMPKKVYDEIGGFDEDYFLYVEDVDLSRKIADKHYKRIFLPRFRYIHFVGFDKSRNPMLIKGYELYIGKHFSGFERATMRAALGINKLVKKLKKTLLLD